MNAYIFEPCDDVPGWSGRVGYQVRRRSDRKFLGYVLKWRYRPAGWMGVSPRLAMVDFAGLRQDAAFSLEVHDGVA